MEVKLKYLRPVVDGRVFRGMGNRMWSGVDWPLNSGGANIYGYQTNIQAMADVAIQNDTGIAKIVRFLPEARLPVFADCMHFSIVTMTLWALEIFRLGLGMRNWLRTYRCYRVSLILEAAIPVGIFRSRMDSLLAPIGLAFAAFVSTNIDDVFILVGFFADKHFRARDVVIGQYLGIGALYVISATAALISLVIPTAYIGLLGLAPIAIGIKKLYYLLRDHRTGAVACIRGPGTSLDVTGVTIANGGDNIAVYTALFAARPAFEVSTIGIVFAVMTGLWCLGAHSLVNHRILGSPIRAQAHRVVPFVLVGLGILILVRTGTIQLLKLS